MPDAACSIADPDPSAGSMLFLTAGSGMEKKSGPGIWDVQ